jgi:hypothetical protein
VVGKFIQGERKMPSENVGEEALRRFVMDEIDRQLKPTHSLLEELKKQGKENHEWMLGFWANGSLRPEGFFQSRIKADDLRYKRLEDETKDQSTTLETLKAFMIEQKLTRVGRELAEKEKEERHARYFTFAKWLLGVIGPVLLAAAGWLAHEASPVIKVLWEEYLKAHPVVTERLRDHVSYEPSLTSTQPQDAKNPPLTR